MRRNLVLAGLVAGVALSVAPLAPALAYCEPEPVVVEGGGSAGCRNSCVETGERYESTRKAVEARVPGVGLPGYWDLFACPM